MDRVRRLHELWNWLPAFRTVAETQHLPTAALAMHVSASALSRSVTMLEDALGKPLFDRGHRQIRLNTSGGTLLAAVRDAMRRIDDGIVQVLGDRHERIRIAGPTPWIRILALASHARPMIDIVEVDEIADVGTALLRGDVDLALGEAIKGVDGIVIERLGDVAWAVCRRTRGRTPDSYAIASEAEGPWPEAVARTVALRARRLETVIEACVAGTARAVLPIALARAHGLQLIRRPLLEPTQLYVARRRPVSPSPLDEIAALMRERAAQLLVLDERR